MCEIATSVGLTRRRVSLMLLWSEAKVKRFSFYMPPAGYVSKPAERVVMFLLGVALIGVVVFAWSSIVDIPPAPKYLVLRSAQVTRPLYVSRAQVGLYFKVDSDEGGYPYRLEMVHENAADLKVRKGENIWVALDADSNNPFVWGVYDDKFKLLVGRQQIEWGRRYINSGHYFMAICLGLVAMWCLYFLVREVWNRYFYRKDG